MKAFSPAGMTSKAFYGYSVGTGGAGAAGGIGAHSFGNPDGALRGGGAYARGGANINGPNQGGGGGAGPPSGVFNMTAGGTSSFAGFANGTFNFDPAQGSVVPAVLNTTPIGLLVWAFSSHGSHLTFGLVDPTLLQGAFTSLSFTDFFGVHQTYLSSAATFSPSSDGSGVQWGWNAPTQQFAPASIYVITVA